MYNYLFMISLEQGKGGKCDNATRNIDFYYLGDTRFFKSSKKAE